jgi:hypothetical protein
MHPKPKELYRDIMTQWRKRVQVTACFPPHPGTSFPGGSAEQGMIDWRLPVAVLCSWLLLLTTAWKIKFYYAKALRTASL